jgi:nucleoside-diphosphate-sugar epimerase
MTHCSILVTGITGFLGINFIRGFQDYKIIGISRSAQNLKLSVTHQNVDFYTWNDFLKTNLEPSVVINMAGKAHDLKKVNDDSDYIKANVEFTKNVFEWFANSNSRVFIQISSIKAVVDHAKDVVNEATPESPTTIYGRTKLEADTYLERASKKLKNKSVIVLRPSMIHGPGNKGNLNLLYRAVLKKVPYPLGAYTNIRSFTSVDNLLFILRCIIEKSQPGFEKYVVCDENGLSTTGLIQIIGEESKVEPCILNIPKFFISALAKLGDILNLSFNTERLTKLVESFEVDSSAIRKKYSIIYPLSAEEGIRKTIRSFNNG